MIILKVHLGGKKSFLDPKSSLYAFGWISVNLFWGRKMKTTFLKAKASCMTPSKFIYMCALKDNF